MTIPDIERWAEKCLKSGVCYFDIGTWVDLKREFDRTLMSPHNRMPSPSTHREARSFAKIAMICINFLEAAESSGQSELFYEVIRDEKEWLYNSISCKVSECINSLKGNRFSNTFPASMREIKRILLVPLMYAYDDSRAIESMHRISRTRH